MVQKAGLFMKGGQLAPLGKKKVMEINKMIGILQNMKSGKLAPEHELMAAALGVKTDMLKNPQTRRTMINFLKAERSSFKVAVRAQQAKSQKLVMGAGILPPVLSTAAGAGASVATAKHYYKKGKDSND
jgi:hypothetical protein